jgi:putative protease
MDQHRPEILAPAGDTPSFLAALAAGADAVYLGLKAFNARMAAKNFSLSELARMARLAAEKNAKVYVAMNVLMRPSEAVDAGRLVEKLARDVKPAALIISDLGLCSIARQAGWRGGIHLSTIANVTHPAAMPFVRKHLGVSRVILPRELDIDGIRHCAAACPEGLDLEVFVHGALCYGISGRCYWSSFLGGKSGLRGRCVQPCRRLYSGMAGALPLFSCRDLRLDVLVKALLKEPRVAAWKIEGRKKGPHYVYHVARAYRLLRDEGNDPAVKKEALALLEGALGRPWTHYRFLPQRPQVPVIPEGPTASGAPAGATRGEGDNAVAVLSRAVLPGDLLRVGYEDCPGHRTLPVRRALSRGSVVPLSVEDGPAPSPGTPVFLVDRRLPEPSAKIRELQTLLDALPSQPAGPSRFVPRQPHTHRPERKTMDFDARWSWPDGKPREGAGIWLLPETVERAPKGAASKVWWWLPPVVWPEGEAELSRGVERLLSEGARRFVLNAPWQAAFFKEGAAALWAGPFMNTANAYSLETLRLLGFAGAIVSPELCREDFLSLPGKSPLPLGVVLSGVWPLTVSRTLAEGAPLETALASPRGEVLWVRRHGENYWVYPGWTLDLEEFRAELREAGYSVFVRLEEPWPAKVPRPSRSGIFNYRLKLL